MTSPVDDKTKPVDHSDVEVIFLDLEENTVEADLASPESLEVVVISSFEEYEAIFRSSEALEGRQYVFRAKDTWPDLSLDARSPRLLLDYLPVYVGTSDVEAKLSSDSIKAFKYAGTLIDFDKGEVDAAIRCFSEIDLLNSGALIDVSGEKLCLPYGQFTFDNDVLDRFNPLVLERIVDIYCDKTVYQKQELVSIIEANLTGKIFDYKYSADNEPTPLNPGIDEYDLLAGIYFPSPNSLEYSAIGNNVSRSWQIIKDFFFRTVLPLAFMNGGFKSFVGCSLLNHDDLTERNCARISMAFFYYICGIRDVARVLNTKSKEVASCDASDIFSGRYSKSTLRRSEWLDKEVKSVKADAVKSVFAIDGEKRQTIELTGLSVSSEAMNAFTALGKKHPHFSKVFDYLLPFVESSFFNGSPLVIPPMLIAGPPGIGKTKFISELFGVFGYPISHCHSSQFTCGSGLVGLQSTWSNTQPGYVAEAQRRSKLYNPLIAFDELERVRMAHQGGNGISVEAAFMRLLEPLEATRFVDACGQLPHDVSKVNWIFTCNEPSHIPPALLSRLNKVCVYPPTEESVIDNIHRDIWLDLVNQYASGGLVKPWISADALEHLREVYYGDLNFRSGIKVMKNGLNKLMSGVQDSSYLTLDVIASKTLRRASLN